MTSPLKPRGRSPLANRRAPLRATASLLIWALAPMTMLTTSARALEPPPRPAAPSVERAGSEVHLTLAVSAGATRYEVYRGSTRIGATEGSTFIDDEAPAGRAFYFVTACRSWACSPGSRGVTAPAAAAVVRLLPAGSAVEAALGACEIDRTALTLERDELWMEVDELLARLEWLTGESPDEKLKARRVEAARTFDCLDAATDVVTVAGSHTDKYTVTGAPGRAWDARGFDTFTDDIRHGAVVMRAGAGSPGGCWAGGYVRSTRALGRLVGRAQGGGRLPTTRPATPRRSPTPRCRRP